MTSITISAKEQFYTVAGPVNLTGAFGFILNKDQMT